MSVILGSTANIGGYGGGSFRYGGAGSYSNIGNGGLAPIVSSGFVGGVGGYSGGVPTYSGSGKYSSIGGYGGVGGYSGGVPTYGGSGKYSSIGGYSGLAPMMSAPMVSAPMVSAPMVSAPMVSAPIAYAPMMQEQGAVRQISREELRATGRLREDNYAEAVYASGSIGGYVDMPFVGGSSQFSSIGYSGPTPFVSAPMVSSGFVGGVGDYGGVMPTYGGSYGLSSVPPTYGGAAPIVNGGSPWGGMRSVVF